MNSLHSLAVVAGAELKGPKIEAAKPLSSPYKGQIITLDSHKSAILTNSNVK